MPKLVFSRTLKKLDWQNSTLLNGDLVAEVKKLKQGDGDGYLMLGSGNLIQQITEAGLIDEFVFILTPTVLGKGKPQFKQEQKVDFDLIKSQSFPSGNILMHYRVK